MNKVLASMVLLVAWGLVAGSVSAAGDAAGKELALFCAEPVSDFGKVDSTHTITAEFKLSNRGTAPLEIAQLRPSCACLTATLSQETIPAGGAVTLKASMPLADYDGEVTESLLVVCRDRTAGLLKLQIKGTAIERVKIEPAKIVFARILADETASQTATIATKDPKAAFAITKVECSLVFLEATAPRGDERLAAHQVVVRTKAPLPPGRFSGTLRVTTDSKDYPLIQIPVTGKVVGELDVSPEALTLVDDGRAGLKVRRSVEIGPGQVRSFTIKEVVPPLESMKVAVKPLGDNRYLVQVSNIPVSRDLDGQELRITTDAPGMTEIRVPFRVVKPGQQ